MKKYAILILTLMIMMSGCGGKNADSTPTAEENKQITDENAKVVKVDILQKRELSESTTLSGDVLSDNTEVVSTVVAGTILEINVNVGDVVKKDDVIASLDDEWLRMQYQQANIQYDNAKIQQAAASRNYERVNSLYQSGAVTKAEFEQASDALKAAKLGFKSAQNSKNQMDYQLRNMNITSPIDGTISKLFQQSGAAVANGSPICEVVNTADMIVETGVSESQVSLINQGQKVDILIPSINQIFTGTVENIGPSPNINKTYPVRVHIDNPNSQLKIGMFAQLQINTISSHTAIAVPKTAVVSEEGEDYVFVVNENKATRKSVELGSTFEDYFEIIKGINEGDKIVISGQEYLANGDIIRIVE